MISRIPGVILLIAITSVSGGCQQGTLAVSSIGERPVYTHGAVAADHLIGSEAGVEMLKLGGNAVDAAVAASFTQAVVRPFSCGLGGGGFMVIHRIGDERLPEVDSVVIYRETAPEAVGVEFYVDLNLRDASRYGPYASGVPGTVAGLLYALDRYGTLDRQVVLGPAIRAAEGGLAIDGAYVDAAKSALAVLDERPELVEVIGEERVRWLRARYLFDGGPQVGAILRQPELARTLRLIAEKGPAVFYAGDIAAEIAAASATIEQRDLARYEVEETQPLRTEFLGYEFLTMPPPSSGGVAMIEILGFLARHQDRLRRLTPDSADYVHLLVEAMKHAFADRAEWLADTKFSPVPIDRLTSELYLDGLAAKFDPDRTFDLDYYGSRAPAPVDGGTSHISVVDRWGNAVAVTETINLGFGSLNVVPSYGLILNNEMDDFLTIPGEPNAFGLTQSDRNLPAPGKRPLSSMSPTIVLNEAGKVEIVAGASGGPRIITGTLEVILNLLLFTDDPEKAVAAPRFHHQWAPNVLWLEHRWMNDAARSGLMERGHEIDERSDVGIVQVISRAGEEGWSAASDPRKGGRPAGW